MFEFLSHKAAVYRSKEWFWLSVVFAVCAAVMLPMALTGVPEGYDIGQHLRQASAFRDAVLEGDIIPGWADKDSYGFGSISVRFYPPIADYLMGIVDIFTGNWRVSFLATSIFLMFPGCFGMYYWAREYLSRPKAALAAFLFAVMPYHLLQIYQYTLFSEYAAASVLPFCFWFLTRVINRHRNIDVLLFGTSFAILILTHLPSSIMGSLTLAIYALFLIDWRRAKETIFKLFVAGFLAICATSFYWLRLVTELGWVNINNAPDRTSGFYSFVHYLFPIYLSSADWVYWLRMMWMIDAIIVLTIFSLLFGIICSVLIRKRKDVEGHDKKFLFALAVTSVFLIFIISIPSTFVWQYLPVLHKIQFPFRFLSLASIIASISAAISIPLFFKTYPGLKRVIGYSAIALLAGILIYDLTLNILTSAPFTPERFETLSRGIHERDGCECFYPLWGTREAFDQREKVTAESRSVNVSLWEREERKFAINEGAAGNARIATFWYPHWKAVVNGTHVEVGRDENGAILIPLPEEGAEVRLYFQEPVFLEVAKYVSLITWLIIPLALYFAYRRDGRGSVDLAAIG